MPHPSARLTWLISELVASHAGDAGSLFDRAAELVGRTFSGSSVVAVLFDEGARIQPLGVFHGDGERKAALRSSSSVTWSPVDGVVADVVATGTPVVIGPADVRSAARFSPWAATLLDAEQDSCGIIVVMRTFGRPVGVLVVVRSAAHGSYEEPEMHALQLVGDNLGLAARAIELGDDVERLSAPALEVPLGDGRLALLSSREEGILRAVERGLSSREIGEELHLSPRTVEWHRARIIAKLGTTGRAELMAMARHLP